MTVWARGARALKALISFSLALSLSLSPSIGRVSVQYDMGYRVHVCTCVSSEQTRPSVRVIVRACECVQKTLLRACEREREKRGRTYNTIMQVEAIEKPVWLKGSGLELRAKGSVNVIIENKSFPNANVPCLRSA